MFLSLRVCLSMAKTSKLLLIIWLIMKVNTEMPSVTLLSARFSLFVSVHPRRGDPTSVLLFRVSPFFKSFSDRGWGSKDRRCHNCADCSFGFWTRYFSLEKLSSVSSNSSSTMAAIPFPLQPPLPLAVLNPSSHLSSALWLLLRMAFTFRLSCWLVFLLESFLKGCESKVVCWRPLWLFLCADAVTRHLFLPSSWWNSWSG